MYRAITYYALQQNYITETNLNKAALITDLKTLVVNFKYNTTLGFAEVCLNGNNIEGDIRTLEVSRFVSRISKISEVRRKLVEQQQLMGKDKGVVMDGRDIGTVVFPDAELKVFMTASAETRAKRRYKELLEKGHNLSYDDVLENVVSRDHIDSTREDSPLVKADDAIAFDNSALTIEEQLTAIRELVEDKLNA